ncbi:integrin alpha-PS1-like [Limulus polyphemus]|uniref:Integrin alpha-PS1-like n=1 Tax=Limulus polyphemus TaxID=6850 RepID=A0ABM1SAG4_LIMPO|nr:integrin alpha-PS1-like [Limulus polyphemus]
MENSCWAWTSIFYFLISVHLTVHGFNLEIRLPLIKQGDRGSYFGFSVAEHLGPGDDKDTDFYPVLLVGAPLAQTKQPGTNRSGALYKCDLTTYRKDCSQINVEPNDVPFSDVDRNGQWLGVTVTSQKPGGYVMTCAHRYVLKGPDFRWGEGICYSLNPSLSYDREWGPCRNLDRDKAHEEFGYCQAGVSAYITEDNNVAIGTPGPYTWKGTLFVNNVRFGIMDDITWYRGEVDASSPVKKYSYLGMSVTGGRFFGNHISFVGGAPRSNGTGQVVFFKKNTNNYFLVERVLDGEQFLSSFGYAMASLDINGDGALDLAVGAPFYFSETEGGAVYIYINTENEFKEDTKPVKLTGMLQSAFGLALSGAEDLNKDGYDDLAIGAPYEENGSGAVYIHLGSAHGLITEAAQVIKPSDFPRKALPRLKLTTFGYSLSGGLDMDSNGYPDLLIGAYESDAVILLRSRPIIDIRTTVTGNFTRIDPQKLGCVEDPKSDQVCFSFSTCFEITEHVDSAGSNLRIRYRIEAETFIFKYYRVIFNSSRDSETPNIVADDLTVTVGKTRCKKEVVYLKEKSDIQTPILFKLVYLLVQKDPPMIEEGEELPDLNNYPILNQQEASKTFEATFLKDCGADEICQSNLDLATKFELPRPPGAKYHHKLYLGEQLLNISVKAKNRGEPAYDAAFFISHPSSISYVNHITIANELNIECNPITETLLKCILGNPFILPEVEVQVKFDIRRVEDYESSLEFDFEVNTTSLNLGKQTMFNTVLDIVRVAELKLRGIAQPEQVLYGGEIKGETAMKSEDDIGSPVFHTYEVINDGPFRAKRIEVVISWPFEIENNKTHGKWVLYLMDIPKVEINGECVVEKGQVNPLNIKELPEFKLSIGISLHTMSTDIPVLIIMILSILQQDCDYGSAKCFQILCTINNLGAKKSDVIKIKARLWNSTFVEDYPKVDYVSIISRGKIYLDSDLDIEQNTTNDVASAETKAYPDKLVSEIEKEVPIWIIIVSVACGILLLIIVIIILWKCGFFARPLHQYTVVPKEEKSVNNHPETS